VKRVHACKLVPLAVVLLCVLPSAAQTRRQFVLSHTEYLDRAQAIWEAQMIGQVTGLKFEHRVASVLRSTPLVDPPGHAEPDDDYYYEMVAVRAFEKYGLGLTVQQLGQQWLENNAGTWGSSEQTLKLLRRGVQPPDTGSPRYNKLWWTIGPQFSSDLYGILAPGMPNVAAELARRLGHINGYAEGTDGAVFVASMVSLGFVEKDSRTIVRKAAQMISPRSPYRQCLDAVIRMAEAGKQPGEIADAINDRWGIEYPATNNAVVNGGIVAISVWFGGGDFLKTENIAFTAADYADTDCNAANAGSVVAAMHGMAALPAAQVIALHDRVFGDHLGDVALTPPVDESISGLAARTVAIGERILLQHGAQRQGSRLAIFVQHPVTQASELFTLTDLGKLWNPQWTLERAGYGGAGGGLFGLRGDTYLDGGVLAVFPRDEVRGALLRRQVRLDGAVKLSFDAGADPGRTWHLQVFADNDLLLDRRINGGPKQAGAATAEAPTWQHIEVDLAAYKGRTVTLRLYDLILVPGAYAGNSYWRDLSLR